MKARGSYDIDDSARADALEILDECSSVPSVSGGAVDALGRVIVELLLGEGELDSMKYNIR